MSCLKKERKPIVPLKTLDVIFRRRYVKNTQFYFTNRKQCLASKTENLDGKTLLPYRAPKSDKLLSYIRYSDREKRCRTRRELSQPLHFKSDKNATEVDISRRLFMEGPPDDVKTVVAIHPEFYTCIEGRPLRMFDDIKVYINNIRNYAMSRQQLGYRRDLMMKIEKNILEESEEYDKISNNLRNYAHYFQEFLIEDYNEACALESKADRIYAELLAKQTELLKYSSYLININNEIYKLDSTANILKSYRKFLMLVAPLTWRQKHDESFRDNIPEDDLLSENNLLSEARDIDRIVEEVKMELLNPRSVHMYFKHSEELMDLFRAMQIQSRDYLIQRSKSQETYYRLLRRINQLKAMATDNLEYFNYYIEKFQKELDREEYNQKHVKEKFYRILNNNFFEDIASLTSLGLQICVEFVYEQVIGKYEEGQSLKDVMTVLENMYQDYNLRLDTLDFNTVNKARNDIFAQDLKTMKNAYNAERELKAFREMTKALNQAFAPPKEYNKPKMSVQLSRKGNSNITNKTDAANDRTLRYNQLSLKKRNFLLYFTEWCDDTDPWPFLEQL
ncbi:uncharacterized protein LOC121739328 [Aricia agestis]|uniref:uncharacterized protein LOC121739328 n=1 Tax=Aricia agestis TaxID=91739 RepID=UPI001C20BDF9|nr:uncharacterized protein LOC121739328 [Aricia agestis]